MTRFAARHHVSADDLSRRLPVALIGAPVVVGLTALGGIPFLVLVAVLSTRGQWELMRFFEPGRGNSVCRCASVAVGLGLLADAFWGGGMHWAWLLLAGTGLVLLLLVFSPAEQPSVGVAGGAALSWLYVVIPLAHLLWLRGSPGPVAGPAGGALAVIGLWAVIWVNDTTAYFVGSAFGRHKMLPGVSPGKSWEGTLAGLAGAAATGALLAGTLSALAWPIGRGILLGLVLGAGALLGDLIESRLKRGAGLKDAGGLLLGHGGVLDRFDSTLVGAPLLYYLLFVLGGSGT